MKIVKFILAMLPAFIIVAGASYYVMYKLSETTPVSSDRLEAAQKNIVREDVPENGTIFTDNIKSGTVKYQFRNDTQNLVIVKLKLSATGEDALSYLVHPKLSFEYNLDRAVYTAYYAQGSVTEWIDATDYFGRATTFYVAADPLDCTNAESYEHYIYTTRSGIDDTMKKTSEDEFN